MTLVNKVNLKDIELTKTIVPALNKQTMGKYTTQEFLDKQGRNSPDTPGVDKCAISALNKFCQHKFGMSVDEKLKQ